MKANINKEELNLLTYFHEHATGYTEEHAVIPSKIQKAMGMSSEAFDRASSYLVSHGLLGRPNVPKGGAFIGSGMELMKVRLDAAKGRRLFLTGLGEDYMRELESSPGMPKRLTVETLKIAGQAGLDVAKQVLTSWVMMKFSGHP